MAAPRPPTMDEPPAGGDAADARSTEIAKRDNALQAAHATDVRWPPGPRQGARAHLVALGLFVVVLLLVGIDLAADVVNGVRPAHLVVEAAALAIALAGVIALWRQLVLIRSEARALHREASELSANLDVARADAVRWREEADAALRGLGAAIDQQFDRWELTRAEREVGLLLLKGLSHKEIAALRETSERTVRQQALIVYRKAGLAGRAELAAFFLEGLLLPAGQRAPDGG